MVSILNAKVVGIYWFFIPLFACYLSIVPLSYVENKKFVFAYMSIYAFITISILPVASNFFGISYNHAIDTPISAGYILYILLGWLLTNIDIRKKERIIIYILGAIGWYLHFYMTIKLTGENGAINGMFKGYVNFPCVLHSVAIFVFVKYCNFYWINKNCLIRKIVMHVKEASLGIYLIHGFFIYVFVPKVAKVLSIGNIGTSLWYRTIGALIIVFICIVITKIIKRWKLGRMILG